MAAKEFGVHWEGLAVGGALAAIAAGGEVKHAHAAALLVLTHRSGVSEPGHERLPRTLQKFGAGSDGRQVSACML